MPIRPSVRRYSRTSRNIEFKTEKIVNDLNNNTMSDDQEVAGKADLGEACFAVVEGRLSLNFSFGHEILFWL